MISAFLNTVKIPELRRRIFFTLAVVVIVRLGAAITTPGVNQAVLQEWFRSTARSTGGGVAALFNLVQRRRAGELRDLFARHHALHQRVDHAAVADGGDSAAGPLGAGRWRAPENHAIHALRDGRALHFPGLFAGRLLPASGGVSDVACPESPIRFENLGIPLVDDPG